jgi:hypothetical protein
VLGLEVTSYIMFSGHIKGNPSKISEELIVHILGLSQQISDDSQNLFSQQVFPINTKFKSDVLPLTGR